MINEDLPSQLFDSYKRREWHLNRRVAKRAIVFPAAEDPEGRHHSRETIADIFPGYAAKTDAALCDPATGIEQRSRAVWSLLYTGHGTFLARSQETTSCRIRTGNGATVVDRIPNELIESPTAIAWLWNRRRVAVASLFAAAEKCWSGEKKLEPVSALRSDTQSQRQQSVSPWRSSVANSRDSILLFKEQFVSMLMTCTNFIITNLDYLWRLNLINAFPR